MSEKELQTVATASRDECRRGEQSTSAVWFAYSRYSNASVRRVLNDRMLGWGINAGTAKKVVTIAFLL